MMIGEKYIQRHPLLNIHNTIKSRCYNSKYHGYKFYGSRGITMCDEWRNDSKAFYDWAISAGWNWIVTISLA